MTLNDISVKEVTDLLPEGPYLNKIEDLLTPLQKAILQAGLKILDEDYIQRYKAEQLSLAKNKLLAQTPWYVRWSPLRWLLPSDLLGWRTYRVGCVAYGYGCLDNDIFVPGIGVIELPEEISEIGEKFRKTGAYGIFGMDQLDDDPFLFVRDGREKYYLFAWDEDTYIPR